jgi:hypothetical protein
MRKTMTKVITTRTRARRRRIVMRKRRKRKTGMGRGPRRTPPLLRKAMARS